MNCFTASIHAPGFGTNRNAPGKTVSSKYGEAIPSARKVKISRSTNGGCPAANPSDDPMNGAVHGVAASVASAPFKNDDGTPLPTRPLAFASSPTNDAPNSNTPNKFNPSRKKSRISAATNPGDCI